MKSLKFLQILPILIISGCKGNTVQVTEPPIPAAGYTTPDHYAGMTLAWQDEFNGDHLNTADWNYETGGSGWGNHELEYYQDKNTSVHDGYLIIKANQEKMGGKDYTSSRLTTQGKKLTTQKQELLREVLQGTLV